MGRSSQWQVLLVEPSFWGPLVSIGWPCKIRQPFKAKSAPKTLSPTNCVSACGEKSKGDWRDQSTHEWMALSTVTPHSGGAGSICGSRSLASVKANSSKYTCSNCCLSNCIRLWKSSNSEANEEQNCALTCCAVSFAILLPRQLTSWRQ